MLGSRFTAGFTSSFLFCMFIFVSPNTLLELPVVVKCEVGLSLEEKEATQLHTLLSVRELTDAVTTHQRL